VHEERKEKELPDTMDVGEQRVEYVPFYGTRVREFEFGNRIICWMSVKGPVMRVVGVFEILVRKNKGEHDRKRKRGKE